MLDRNRMRKSAGWSYVAVALIAAISGVAVNAAMSLPGESPKEAGRIPRFTDEYATPQVYFGAPLRYSPFCCGMDETWGRPDLGYESIRALTLFNSVAI
jgi:hypothetical protein